PHTRQYLREVDLPFHAGAFPWGPGKPQARSLVDRLFSMATLGLAGGTPKTEELLTQPGDAFRMVVKEHLPASAQAREHVTDPTGSPMARIRLRVKPPGMPEEMDAFPSEDEQWFTTDKRFYRVARAPMRGAPAMVTFSAVDRPELVEDFLKPPATDKSGVARFRYPDRSGHTRVFDWALDGQQGKSVTLPESDLTAALTEIITMPTQESGLSRVLGDDPLPIAVFKITRAGGEAITHYALANLPMVPNTMPSQEEPAALAKPPLASIHYMLTPTLDPRTNGRFGQIDILAGPDHRLSYRVFGRGKEVQGEIRDAGPLSERKLIPAFGGGPNMPMKISFEVEQYLPSGVARDIFVPILLPKGKKDEGIGACRVEMTVGKESKEVWLRRSLSLDPPAPTFVTFGDGVYAIAYDVDRKPLGFELKLDDFDVGFEPGTEQATKFVSKVRLTDASEGTKDQPHTISMNHPLYHQGYTFYQSRYQPDMDPQTERPTGRFQSIFQVAINPGRPIIYAGCMLVVLGAFVQFYMRAGLFTDGGKKEREHAAARARAKADEHQLARGEEPPPKPEDNERL
ncbi:MAG: cytochrome c biogenesis protein ResB, partial [Isosphaeraceae bacterium]